MVGLAAVDPQIFDGRLDIARLPEAYLPPVVSKDPVRGFVGLASGVKRPRIPCLESGSRIDLGEKLPAIFNVCVVRVDVGTAIAIWLYIGAREQAKGALECDELKLNSYTFRFCCSQ